MDIRKSPESAMDAGTRAAAGGFRIRYGRTGIALVGLAALLTAFVSGVLLLFGLGTPLLTVSCLVAAVAAVVLLRSLAVRDRRAKVDAAFSAAMSAPSRGQVSPASRPGRPETPPTQPDSPLFDAEAHQAQPKPLTATELREAALAVAREAGDTSVRASMQAAPAAATWEPVDVPRPVYVEAAKAERPAPEPLDLPEAPKAVGKPTLKQGTAPAASGAPAARPLTKAQSALSNLDDVLQRRRA